MSADTVSAETPMKKISPQEAYDLAKKALLENQHNSTGGGWSASLGTGSHNASYGCIQSTGEEYKRDYPCHKYLYMCTDALALWSVLKKSNLIMLRPQRVFFHWLMNESPWAKSEISFPHWHNEEWANEDQLFEHGFVFPFWFLEKTPANVIHNFLVAARGIHEWPWNISMWYKLVFEFGVNPTLAYVMTAVVGQASSSVESDYTEHDYSGKFYCRGDNKYDWPFDALTSDKSYWLNFLSGKMDTKADHFTAPFFPNGSNPPINCIWGDNHGGNFFNSVLLPVMKKYGTTSKKTDSWGSERQEVFWSWPEMVCGIHAIEQVLFEMMKEKAA